MLLAEAAEDPDLQCPPPLPSCLDRRGREQIRGENSERVNTVESEMLQIDEAIAIQSNENLGLSTWDQSHGARLNYFSCHSLFCEKNKVKKLNRYGVVTC
ncbi:hypothetical protein MRB53_003182 [Persea americana]|uniref:Uncharacterized protein n=1 Tax=Persea americana TaxID=3435 RepID=A0ACC2MYA4_PERAE|nr:hypothetical protein MRB53_003182 [Persea americana]